MYSKELKQKAIEMFFVDGRTRKDIAKELGVVGGRDVVKKWVLKYRRNTDRQEFLSLPDDVVVDIPTLDKTVISNKETDKRLKTLEMQLDLLKNFLYETERWLIKKSFTE